MTRRRIAAAFVCVAALLFAGRWGASLLAERLWAAPFGPDAVHWMTQMTALRLLLDGAASLIAAVWFAGNLVAVVRGIERVQLSRAVADGLVREAVRPELLFGGAILAGSVLGVLLGGDLSASWPTIALAWQGVRFGMTEPLLAQDLGVYVAQLPFWELLHDGLFVLALGALLLVTLLYAAIGALRWRDGTAAITDHARRHLGWLAAIFALVLAAGYLLEPLQWVAAGPEAPARGAFALVELGAPVLTGFALATSLLSLLWVFRGRHAGFAAGWLLLLLASVLVHYVVPSLQRSRAPSRRSRWGSTPSPIRRSPGLPPMPPLGRHSGVRPRRRRPSRPTRASAYSSPSPRPSPPAPATTRRDGCCFGSDAARPSTSSPSAMIGRHRMARRCPTPAVNCGDRSRSMPCGPVRRRS